MSNRGDCLIKLFKRCGGIVQYPDIKKAGFHNDILQSLIASGRIQKMSRSVYKLSEVDDLINPDLVIATIKAPKGVVCLISALAFYEVTDEIPRHVDLAILRGAHANKISHPPVKYYRFTQDAWQAGIEVQKIVGQEVRIYSLAKTIADCFKFRNKIGFDVALKALKTALSEKKVSPKEIMMYAKTCRVVKVIQPILESLI
ncbi:MAG: type IV toxin-antitoxin system AbiEi family antitoxin domain-containing protein [Candidatus Omnitrophica bacterium]|nr:type IV toxin-antitoxin system AbiEi family antitoxin domain-containing protein [Candidatus Omnitrophota bacterium]